MILAAIEPSLFDAKKIKSGLTMLYLDKQDLKLVVLMVGLAHHIWLATLGRKKLVKFGSYVVNTLLKRL